MELRNYLKTLDAPGRSRFACEVGTTIGYLRKAVSVGQALAPRLCMAIERRSNGAVTRAELRPDDYWLIWPDLHAPEPLVISNRSEQGG